MATSNQDILTQQHRSMEAGILGLVDGSGSRAELTDGVLLLRRHIYVEEAFLFPAIEQDARRLMALARMRYEHGDMWPHIESALALLRAKAELEALLPDAEALVRLLREHDPKEEEALYTAADRYRPDATHPAFVELFSATDLPEGWQCRYAQKGDGGN